jgi:hypothetical protein
MRVIIENVLLFLLPVALYIGYMLLTRRDQATTGSILNDAPLVWLFAAGAVLVLVTLVLFGSTSGSKPGQTYYPPYSKDGRIVPGEYK